MMVLFGFVYISFIRPQPMPPLPEFTSSAHTISATRPVTVPKAKAGIDPYSVSWCLVLMKLFFPSFRSSKSPEYLPLQQKSFPFA